MNQIDPSNPSLFLMIPLCQKATMSCQEAANLYYSPVFNALVNSQIHVNALVGKLLFLPYPAPDQYYMDLVNRHSFPQESTRFLFVRQVPRFLSDELIAWTIDTMMGTRIVVSVPSNPRRGSTRVVVKNEEAQRKLIDLSKSLIFDLNGIWYSSFTAQASRTAQIQFLDAYCSSIEQRPERRIPRYLPIKAIVIEEPSYLPRSTH